VSPFIFSLNNEHIISIFISSFDDRFLNILINNSVGKYIIEKAKEDKYKCGYWEHTLHKLEQRYVTYLVDPIVYFFHPTHNVNFIEAEVKKRLDQYRMSNGNGTKTEWFHIKLDILIATILEIINENKPIDDVDAEFTIQNNKFELIDISNCYRNDCQYLYSVHFNKSMIGEFRILYEEDNDELAIDKIKIKTDDKNLIISIIDTIMDFTNNNYPAVQYYIINCGNIKFAKSKNKTVEISNEEYIMNIHKKYQLQKIFVDTLLHNKYFCYSIDNPANKTELAYYQINIQFNIPKFIVLLKPKINNNITFKHKNICDVFLSFDKNIYPHPDNNTLIVPYIKLFNRIPQISCQRNFSVTREKVYDNKDSDFSYMRIKITFDKPIVFMSDSVPHDIYMKFIVKNFDFTSETGEISDFSFDYRFNKLSRALNNYYMIGSYQIYKHIYIINGFSYYESPNDYINHHYDTKKSRNNNYFNKSKCPYPQLCTMVKRIYQNCK